MKHFLNYFWLALIAMAAVLPQVGCGTLIGNPWSESAEPLASPGNSANGQVSPAVVNQLYINDTYGYRFNASVDWLIQIFNPADVIASNQAGKVSQVELLVDSLDFSYQTLNEFVAAHRTDVEWKVITTDHLTGLVTTTSTNTDDGGKVLEYYFKLSNNFVLYLIATRNSEEKGDDGVDLIIDTLLITNN